MNVVVAAHAGHPAGVHLSGTRRAERVYRTLVDNAQEAGRRLGVRHRAAGEPEASETADSLIRYAESGRAGDWTLRSALVRLAQPEPVRAGAVLELIRRCDGAIAPFTRRLEAAMTQTDPRIDLATLVGNRWSPSSGQLDIRVADLARLAWREPEVFPALLEGYREEVDLHDDEVAALPYLEAAIVLDDLAVTLTDWAAAGSRQPPPCELVDARCTEAFELLEALGVAREQRPSRR
jgi:hypothetical protein